MPAKAPTAEQRRLWNAIIELGCIVGPSTHCAGRITIHHCGTGAGGRKDHNKVIGLCWAHHLGPEGIDGQKMSKRTWQAKYGLEVDLLKRTNVLLLIKTLEPYGKSPAMGVTDEIMLENTKLERKLNV